MVPFISRTFKMGILAALLVLGSPNIASAQTAPAQGSYKLTTAKPCVNYKGESVTIIDTNYGNKTIAAGMAIRDKNGRPVNIRSNFSATPPHFQRFIDNHECAHQQTGDIDRPHPRRNSPDHLMNESISDCIAILRLRDEDDGDRKAFDQITATMSTEMARIGFPKISISSRIANIKTCFNEYGPPDDYVKKVLQRRGLLQAN